MAFKLKKSADQLFHRIAESKHNGGEATSQPMLNTGTPMKPDGGPKMMKAALEKVGKQGAKAARKMVRQEKQAGRKTKTYADAAKESGMSKEEMNSKAKDYMSKSGTPMKPAKGPKMAPKSPNKVLGIGGAYLAGKLVKKGAQVYADYAAGKAARTGQGSKNTKATSKSSGSGSYAKAAKKDPNLASYIKQRKGLDKSSDAYKKLQNKINAAYGVSKRYKLSGDGGSASNESKPKVSKVQAAKINVKKVKVDAKKSIGSARANKLNVKSEVAREAGKTKKADRLDRRAKRTQGRADRGGSKVGVAIKGIFRKKQK